MYEVGVNGVKSVEQALQNLQNRLDFAAKKATEQVGLKAVEVMQETIIPVYNDGHMRPDGRTTDSPIGTPPMTRTGALRANIVSVDERLGFGSYVTSVGSMVEYARALELGLSNGARYPFVQPASDTMVRENYARDIYASFAKAALRR